MENTRRALLQAILASPADDTPRLVFADWLEENGETEWAWLIRYQIDRKTTGICVCAAAHEMSHNLCFTCKLFDLPPSKEYNYTTSRGFISEIRGPLTALLEHGPAIVAENPVERVSVTGHAPFGEYAFGYFGPDTTPEQFRLALLNELRRVALATSLNDPRLTGICPLSSV